LVSGYKYWMGKLGKPMEAGSTDESERVENQKDKNSTDRK